MRYPALRHTVRLLLAFLLLNLVLPAAHLVPAVPTAAAYGPPPIAVKAPAAAVKSPSAPQPTTPPTNQPAHAPIRPAQPARPLPLAFVPNAGQTDQRVRYQVSGMGGTMFFTPNEVVLAIPTGMRTVRRSPHDPTFGITNTRAISQSVVRLSYVGANGNPQIAPVDRLPGNTNYLLGNQPANWQTNLPTYRGIVYEQLYPGIDLRFDSTEGQLKSTYTLTPQGV